LSFALNVSIRCRVRVAPADGSTAPTGVLLTLTDPNGVHSTPAVTSEGLVYGAWQYVAVFTPTVIGPWERVWSATNLSTTDPKTIDVA
jgi:hypothetical protein